MLQGQNKTSASFYILVSVWMIPVMISAVAAQTTVNHLFYLGTLAGPTASSLLFISRKIKQYCCTKGEKQSSDANDKTKETDLEGSTYSLLKQLGHQLTELSRKKAELDVEYYPLKKIIKSGDMVEKKVTKSYVKLKTARRKVKNEKAELTHKIADLNNPAHKTFNA